VPLRFGGYGPQPGPLLLNMIFSVCTGAPSIWRVWPPTWTTSTKYDILCLHRCPFDFEGMAPNLDHFYLAALEAAAETNADAGYSFRLPEVRSICVFCFKTDAPLFTNFEFLCSASVCGVCLTTHFSLQRPTQTLDTHSACRR